MSPGKGGGNIQLDGVDNLDTYDTSTGGTWELEEERHDEAGLCVSDGEHLARSKTICHLPEEHFGQEGARTLIVFVCLPQDCPKRKSRKLIL